MKTDYIDLYWLHAWDYTTPLEEVMRALDDLIRAGKVLYIGISDTPAWVVSRANMMAELRGWTQFIALQLQYSLIERTIEREFLPMARELDLAITPWGVLGAGILSGKYNTEKNAKGRANLRGGIDKRKLRIAEEVIQISKKMECSPSQVALSWVRQQPGVIIPILGAKKLSQLKDNLGCLEVELSQNDLARLERVSKIEMGFPHDFLSSPAIQDIVYGGTHDQIDNHRSR
jgi:aryl-alcohol dehydrogenase-like predicted oxidoreductase